MVAEVDLRILVDLAIGQARRDLATLEKDFTNALGRIHASKGNIDLISNEDLNRANEFLRKIIQVNSIEDRMEKTRNREVTARSRISQLAQQSGEREEQRQKRMLADAEKAARLGGAKFGFQTQVGNAAIMSDITSAVRGMPTPALTGGLGVFGAAPRLADSSAIIAGMASRAGIAASAIQRVAQEGDKAAGSMQRLGTQGKFSIRVLEAFVLYRGFVFLEQSIMGSVRAMMDLDRSVSRVLTQLPNFGQGMRGVVGREILATAKETGLAFADVADALYQVTSAGISGQAAFDAMNLSAKAAVAGGTTVANAFNSALSQMSAFRLETEDLSGIYDKQFNLIKRGIFSYEQLTTVVGITGDAFYQAGQSLETANAALAAVSETFTGPQLTRGATALRNLVLAVAEKPDEFRKLGVETRDASGEIRDLIPILESLDKALGSMTTGAKAEALKEILPDIRQRQGAVALLGSMDSLRRNYVEQKLALGDLDRAYKVVHGDIRAQTDILKTNIQSGFKPLAGLVGMTFEGINKLDQLMPGFTSNLIGTTAAVTGLAIAWQYLNQTVSIGSGAAAQQMSRMAAMKKFMGSTAFRYGGAAVIGAGIGGAAGSGGGGPGSAIAGILGGAASGAAFGIGGGAAGIGIGAAVGAGTALLSYAISAWRSSAEETGVTFAESFTSELKSRSGDVGGALAAAFAAATDTNVKSSLDSFREAAAQGTVYTSFTPKGTGSVSDTFREEDVQRILEQIKRTGSVTMVNNTPAGRGRESTITSEEQLRVITGNRRPGDFSFMLSEPIGEAVRRGFDKATGAKGEITSNEQLVRLQAAKAGVEPDQLRSSLIKESVQDALEEALPGNTTAQLIVQNLFGDQGDVARLDEFLRILETDGVDAAIDFAVGMREGADVLEQVQSVWELSANSFEDALSHAADVIRNGLVESAGYTADELEMLGEEFADLNRVVKKVGLIKELEGIGQFLFDDPNFQLQSLRESLLNEARMGGNTIKSLLTEDGGKGLLGLIDTLIETGDVNVDQSTNNNIVIRISGGTDLDTLKAAEAADAILRELNNAQRGTR